MVTPRVPRVRSFCSSTHTPCVAARPSQARDTCSILVVVNVVEADKKQQFEDYLKQFHAALEKVSASDATVKRMDMQTRVLSPAEANPDGTYTYVFLMDPLVEGADYNMQNILKKAVAADEAERLFQQFADAIITEKHLGVELIQSPR
jgi:hypothetical protein